MTITDMKRKQIAQLLEQANAIAIENGASQSRSFEELRFFSGIVRGLQVAAGIIEESINSEDE